VSRRARIRAAAVAAVALAIGLAFATGAVRGAWASFQAESQNTATVAGGWLPVPAGTGIAIGGTGNSQAVMTWTLSWTGTGSNPANGQAVLYADGGSASSASCPAGTYTTTAATIANVTTLTSSLTGSNLTDWWCFQVQTTSTSYPTWIGAPATFSAVRPLVPTSVTTCGSGCGSNSGQIEQGDKITIHFNSDQNQAVSYSGSSVAICAYAGTGTGVLVIGDANVAAPGNNNNNCGGSGAADTATIGKITNITVGAKRLFFGSTVSASGSTLVITVGTAGGSGTSSRTSVSGTGSYTGAGSTVTATTGGWSQCTTASGPNCVASASISF
jgi:hypothetical protein